MSAPEFATLTATEAARFLGVDHRTIRRWPIPYHQYGVRGWRRYSLADLREWQARTRIEGHR
jgi:transposase-like protein